MASNLKPLSSVAEVLPGYSVKGRVIHNPEGEYQIIMGKHLREGLPYRYSGEEELRIKAPRRVEPYRVNSGDVLFTSRGHKNYAVLLEDVPEHTIASSTFYVVRTKGAVDPAYLAWALNQPAAQAAIGQVRTGAGVAIVQRRAFEEIRLPIPSLDTQRKIAHLSGLMGRERLLQEQLMIETKHYHQMLGHCLWNRLSKPNKDC